MNPVQAFVDTATRVDTVTKKSKGCYLLIKIGSEFLSGDKDTRIYFDDIELAKNIATSINKECICQK